MWLCMGMIWTDQAVGAFTPEVGTPPPQFTITIYTPNHQRHLVFPQSHQTGTTPQIRQHLLRKRSQFRVVLVLNPWKSD